MKIKRIITQALCFAVLLSVCAVTVLADDSTDDVLVIEIPEVDAEPGEIIDLPVIITSNPGISVIKDLRIDLRRGLALHFPEGRDAYDSIGSAATWPYVPEKTTTGDGKGMLPVMGRPTAANIGDNHIVFNFLDVTLPYNSTDTGTLITLRVEVTEAASGEMPVAMSGGMYGDTSLAGDKEPVLVHGAVVDITTARAGGGAEDSGAGGSGSTQAAIAPGLQVPRDVITTAPDTGNTYIRLTPGAGTVVTPDMIREMIESDAPVIIEFPDGTTVEIDPADIPAAAADAGFDLADVHPDSGAAVPVVPYRVVSTAGDDESSAAVPALLVVILVLIGGAVIAVSMMNKKRGKGKHEA